MIIDLIKPVDAAALNAVLDAIDDLTFRVEAVETAVGTLTTTVNGFNGRITQNETDIGTLQTDVGTLQTDVGTLQTDVGSNTTAIGVNAGAIATNVLNIGTNTSAIAAHALAIAANTTDIGTNASGISANALAIAANATNIGTNGGLIAGNTTAIGVNAAAIALLDTASGNQAAAIAQNTTDIGINAGNIATNATDIGTNASGLATEITNRIQADNDIKFDGVTRTQLDFDGATFKTILELSEAQDASIISIGSNATAIGVNAANIATNTTDIGSNATAIGINISAIAAHALLIADNTTAIGVNAGNIAANTTAIGTNTTAIGVNASGIATNVTAIAANAAAILANTTAIGTNATNIASNDADILALQGQVGTNTTNITNNTTSINTNTTNIASNAADILANAAAIAAIDTTTITGITELHADTAEPTGFLNRTDSVISFNPVTLTFTIAPAVTDYSVYIKGIKQTIAAPLDLIIANTTGEHYLYIDELGALNETTSFDADILLRNNAYVASIYWNAVTAEVIYVGDERHGTVMDWATHTHFHLSFGAQYVSGFGLTNIIADGSGDVDTHAQLSVGNGVFKDEDLTHSIVNGAQQILSPVAQIPIIYREGTNAAFRILPETNYVVHPSGTGRASWNEFTGATWQISEVPNNDFVLAHIIATNDISHPMIAVMGTTAYPTKSAAQLGANDEISNLGALPYEEIVPVATVIFKTADSFANAVKSAIWSTDDNTDYIDWRTVQINPTITLGDHNVLAGRGALDAHPISSITGLEATLSTLEISRSTVVASINTLLTVDVQNLLINASAGNLEVTLPTAVGNQGLMFTIKKTDGTTNEVTVVPDGVETIDGLLSGILTGYNSVSIISDNANWYII